MRSFKKFDQGGTFTPPKSHSRDQKLLLLLLAMLSLLSGVKAVEEALPDGLAETEGNDAFMKQGAANGKPQITITSLSPAHGPVSGDTQVTVRGGPFEQYRNSYPEPKCRFGTDDMIVSAAYTKCTAEPPKQGEKESDSGNAWCIQCEFSPPSEESKPVEFTVSLTGDFTDISSAAQFYYYKRCKVTDIQPHQGPKDGGTVVRVTGENFADYGDATTCSFGTRAVPATVISPTEISCASPASDVVQRPLPFSVSLNGQQQSHDRLDYWYYNNLQVSVVDPSIGPETGGNEIILRGDNFKPFRPELGEVDVTADTYCAFIALDVKVKATVQNSNLATCTAPPSYYYKETAVELSLNNQDFTDDATMYYYYKPPFLFDVEPPQGPVEGNTTVTVVGSDFNNTGNITCKFGKHQVPAIYKSSSEIMCKAPAVTEPGLVDLTISLYPGLYSSPVDYLYYKRPEVETLAPTSGPEEGKTQIQVRGKNFVDLGSNSALCVFNDTKFTNATVISDTEIVCDTPGILNKQGYAELGEGAAPMHDVKVTLDGGLRLSAGSAPFDYYSQPTVTEISPANGPIKGGTKVTLKGQGFGEASAYKRVVRLGYLQVEPESHTNDTMTFIAPAVGVPNTAAVSVSLNGQQFTSQQAVHDPSKTITYDYYREPYASLHSPKRGPTNGGTLIKAQGYGFTQERSHLKDRMWARFVDPSSKTELAPATEIAPGSLSIDAWQWTTPAIPQAQDALLQISLNKQDWHDVKDPAADSSYSYYPAPHVTGLDPSFGHVKATLDAPIQVAGSGFECFDDACSDLQCRFGNKPSQYIYVQAQLVNGGLVECLAPEYTKPDVLKVEVTVNGESFTNDNQTYGYFDPFVLDASPRLLSTNGSTVVDVKGIGFVNTGEAKVKFGNRSDPIVCNSEDCVKTATFIDKHTLRTQTFARDDFKYADDGESINWDPVYVDATVQGNEFTENEVELFYYADPVISDPLINEAPGNIQAQVLIPTDFAGNNMEILDRYATPTCRFTFGSKVEVMDAQIVTYPFTGARTPETANHIHCKSPRWTLDGNDPETADLEVSLNGQQYVPGRPFTFRRDLILHRDVPMAGPLRTASQVDLVGQGYRMQNRDTNVKWGTLSTGSIPAADVAEYTYNEDNFLDTVPGAKELSAFKTEADTFPQVETSLTEGGSYENTTQPSAPNDDAGSNGGPEYIEVGLDETLKYTYGGAGLGRRLEDEAGGGAPLQEWTLYNYNPSSVEFYAYDQPHVQKIHPVAGLTKGGTFVSVVGYDFKYMPEYGIIPHCRFGDKIVRAHFDSSVRLVCQSPPNPYVGDALPFDISLNGVDWVSTGFVYSYYEEPVMTDLYPDMGTVNGGDEVFISGEKFSSHIDTTEFKCRFTPTTIDIPPKLVQAYYINETTIKCNSPGGWSSAARMVVQVTWNGVDFDENHFQFTYYQIHRAHPRSGPSDGTGGDIVISGEGFRDDVSPACKLNNTVYDPVSVNGTEIRCPLPAAEGGDDYFGNVDLAVMANGRTWVPFEGGFQYYEQPVVEDIDPKEGPASGVGIINFYGSGFRADYPLAELGCKIGDATGPAYYVSPRQVKCVVEEIPLLAEEDNDLPAQVSLNSYSYTDVTDDTYYRPYGILHIQPSSGPVGGITTVVVQGEGFVEEEGVTPRCRFGSAARYAIVEAEILSYTRLACRTPENLPLTPTAALPVDLPFAVAISGDEFSPWTQTSQKFRFYDQPEYDEVTPVEVDVGRVVEVYITAADGSEFFEPMPLAPLQTSDGDETDADASAAPAPLSAMRCRFGRFGETNAVFINSTTIKCTTPPGDDPPDSIYRETVILSVAMNGQDFEEDQAGTEFTFVGTAPYISFATIVMTLFAIAFVAYAVTVCTSASGDLDQIKYANVSRGGGGGIIPNRGMSRGGLEGPLRDVDGNPYR